MIKSLRLYRGLFAFHVSPDRRMNNRHVVLIVRKNLHLPLVAVISSAEVLHVRD